MIVKSNIYYAFLSIVKAGRKISRIVKLVDVFVTPN